MRSRNHEKESCKGWWARRANKRYLHGEWRKTFLEKLEEEKVEEPNIENNASTQTDPEDYSPSCWVYFRSLFFGSHKITSWSTTSRPCISLYCIYDSSFKNYCQLVDCNGCDIITISFLARSRTSEDNAKVLSIHLGLNQIWSLTVLKYSLTNHQIYWQGLKQFQITSIITLSKSWLA